MIKFFTLEEEEHIIAAIRAAELHTSGEIRVHLEDEPEHPAVKQAILVFERLKMHRTAARNGVLIYLAPENREFAIIGDKGINNLVPENFWDTERDLLQAQFRRGEFCAGIVEVIAHIGDKLQRYFPYLAEDINELPDEISYGRKTDN